MYSFRNNTEKNNYLNFISNNYTRAPHSKIVVFDELGDEDNGTTYYGTTDLVTFPKIEHTTTQLIGGFPAKTCEFEIYNRSGVVNLNDKEVAVYRGLEINGSTIWVPMGIFKAEDADIKTNINKRSISFKGTDRTRLFEKKYTNPVAVDSAGNDIFTTKTLKWLVEQICTRNGVQLKGSLPLASLQIHKKPNVDEATTDRQMLGYIAEINGCIAMIDRDGSFIFKEPAAVSADVPKTKYKTLSYENTYGPVNMVYLGREGYEDTYSYPASLPTGTEEIKWVIKDNPVVDLDREWWLASNRVPSQILGASMVPFEVTELIDDYIYDIGDIVTITDKNNNTVNVTVLSIVNTSRIKSTLKAETPTGHEAEKALSGSLREQIKAAKFEVDHVNGEIRALLEDGGRLAQVEAKADGVYTEIYDPNTGMLHKLTQTAAGTEEALSAAETAVLTAENVQTALGDYALKTEIPSTSTFVSKTEYNGYKSDTAAELNLVKSRVTTIEGAGYLTSEAYESDILQRADFIKATVKSSIKVGGVNLLRDSECFSSRNVSYSNSTANSGYPKTETADETPSGAAKHFYFKCSTSGAIGVEFTQTASNNLLIPDYSQIEADKPYTFSFWAKGGSSTNGRKISLESLLYFGDGITVTYEGEPSISLYSSWRKYSVTFSLSGTPTAFRIAFKHSGTASTNYTTYISSLQLESGNVVTDWAPCVKDIEDSTDAKLAMYVRVEDGKLVSAIDIEANKISISSNNFTLTRTGEITATSGTIGGWEITNTYFAKAITADGVTTYTSLKTTTPAAMGFGSSSPTDFSDANFRILHNGEAWSGKDTDNQVRLKTGHIDFYYAGSFTARIGQTTNNTIAFEKTAGSVGIEFNPDNSCIYLSKTGGYLCWGSSTSATSLIGISTTSNNLIIGNTSRIGDAYYNVPTGKKHIFNAAAQFTGNVTVGGILLVNNYNVGSSLETLNDGIQTCVTNLNKIVNYVVETTHTFKDTTYNVVRFGKNNTTPRRYTYISGYDKVFVGPGTNFEGNVAVYGSLYLSASPTISLSSSSPEYTTVTANDEEVKQDVFDYFNDTDILLSPSTLISTAAHSSTEIVEDEDGNPQEIITEHPASETTEPASIRFENEECIPDILKSEDSDTIDLVSLACLEWKAIKELIERLRIAENKILQLEGASRND